MHYKRGIYFFLTLATLISSRLEGKAGKQGQGSLYKGVMCLVLSIRRIFKVPYVGQ